MLLRFLLVLLALMPLPALAQDVTGSWALRVEGTTIFRFDITREGAGWGGAWAKPTTFGSDGNNFGRLAGPAVEVRSSASRSLGEWAELTFPDPRPNAVDDVFRFRALGPDRLEMLYADTGLPPYELVRVPPGAAIGPWEAGKIYRRAGAAPATAQVAPPPPARPVVTAPALPPLRPAVTAPALPPMRPAATPPVPPPLGVPAAPARVSAALPTAPPPPPLSGRDADSRIWSLPPATSTASPPRAAPAQGPPAMPTGR